MVLHGEGSLLICFYDIVHRGEAYVLHERPEISCISRNVHICLNDASGSANFGDYLDRTSAVPAVEQ